MENGKLCTTADTNDYEKMKKMANYVQIIQNVNTLL